MFDSKHYVPILRWKQAEWLALKNLSAGDRVRITPLIEITPRSVAPRKRRPTADQMLEKNVADIRDNWGQTPAFVDLWHLSPPPNLNCGLHPLSFLSQVARAQNVYLIPVTGLNRDGTFQSVISSVIASDKHGACFRLLGSDLYCSTLRNDLDALLSQLGLEKGEVDLLVDCQYLEGACQDWGPSLARLHDLTCWRTFTLASGAFPVDLRGFTVGQHLHPRLDWQSWRQQLAPTSTLPRKPTYSDYTIQHPIYAEPPDRPNFSASIRYTTGNHWIIMRGEGVFSDGSPGFQQWPANAQLLCARPEFCGQHYSDGDRYIYATSRQTEHTGSPGTWLQAGINHHLTFVARQISNLYAP